jgi:hypothetical protein
MSLGHAALLIDALMTLASPLPPPLPIPLGLSRDRPPFLPPCHRRRRSLLLSQTICRSHHPPGRLR